MFGWRSFFLRCDSVSQQPTRHNSKLHVDKTHTSTELKPSRTIDRLVRTALLSIPLKYTYKKLSEKKEGQSQ